MFLHLRFVYVTFICFIMMDNEWYKLEGPVLQFVTNKDSPRDFRVLWSMCLQGSIMSELYGEGVCRRSQLEN
jgi:hypothetical protein